MTGCQTGCCDEERCCSKQAQQGHGVEKEREHSAAEEESDIENENENVVNCLAIVEATSGKVWVLDASGNAKLFSIQPGADLGNLCFHTHGATHVDDLMSPCFDHDGNHGSPEESCFCGVETPHLHAHIKHPNTCGDGYDGAEAKSLRQEERLQLLASQILHPSFNEEEKEEDTQQDSLSSLIFIPVSESMPIQCNSSQVKSHIVRKTKSNHNNKKGFKVHHGTDHQDFLVHNKKTDQLYLEHACESCGDSDVHGAFSLSGKRQWESSMNIDVSLHFYDIPMGEFRLENHFATKTILTDKALASSEPAEAALVSSTFHCAAICCSSECPLITMLLEEEEGVKRIDFNVPEKLAIVQHAPSIISAERIVELLNGDDFQATIQEDGAAPELETVSSTFHCAAIGCTSECPLLSMLLEEDEGVKHIEFDVPKKLVMVEHVPSLITAKIMLQMLNDDDFQATIQVDGAAPALDTVRSTFHCATICCSSECPLITMLLEEEEGVKHIDFDVPKKLVMVDHVPSLIAAERMLKLLNDDDFKATVQEDGAAPKTDAIRSTFYCAAICCSSECPLITMLLEEEEGVKHIDFDVPKKLVMVDHVPSLITAERMLKLLNDDDFIATIQMDCAGLNLPGDSCCKGDVHARHHEEGQTLVSEDSASCLGVNATTARSKFVCSGICCSSECAVINKLLRDKKGVENVLINVTTNQVMVDHETSVISAQDLANLLTTSGFKTIIKVDGGGGAVITSTNCRSCLFCDHICCASEIPAIKQILEPVLGVTKVTVNPTTKLVYVDHEFSVISATQICATLGQNGFGSEIRLDGSKTAANAAHRLSMFCPSSFAMLEESSFEENEALEVLLDTAFDKTQVESFHVDRPSRTITVVHNPYAISAQELEEFLCKRPSTRVKLIMDGRGSLHIDYTALAKISGSSENLDAQDLEHNSRYPRPSVIASGVLWIISMLSFIGGNWEYLKYVGLLSVAFGLPPIAVKAFRTLRRFSFDTNTLMLFASLGALALGEFTEAAAVVFLFSLSEWLEARATTRARQTLSAIVNLKPDKAHLLNPETGHLIKVEASVVPIGALVAVKTGDQIPCDGVVVEGQSTVDESSLTGESRPIRKSPKDLVSGGTINSGISQLMVRTTASAENSAVARLIRLVEEAQVNRSETEKMVDEFAKYYTPMVIAGAVLMCTIPWAFGSETGRHWTENGLVLIVVACPCALIISTPVSYVAGLAATASVGVLIKGGAFLESLGRVKTICFDKTGTLTNGEFALLHLETIAPETFSRGEVLEYLALIEERASHPVANALLVRARNEGVRIPASMSLTKHTILAGEGVVGVINGKEVHVGNERLFERLGMLAYLPEKIRLSVSSWKELGGTIGFMSVEGHGIVCAYCAADGVRKESRDVVRRLKSRGLNLAMLTGDNEDAALAVGRQIGLSPDEVQAKLLPQEKLAYLKSLGAGSFVSSSIFRLRKSRDIILFCGDGVNDAPALAAADVGIAIGAGAALAMETADVTLLDSNLTKLEYSLQIGRRVVRTIWENVVFSITVKMVVLGFAIAGKANLWAAIATDVGAMLIVTLNAIRILPRHSATRPDVQLDVDELHGSTVEEVDVDRNNDA